MFFKSFLFFIFLFSNLLNNATALECWGRIAYFQEPFSNKCMTCEQINFRNTGQNNCKFPNTDYCCESNLCNENNPNFMDWVNEVCEIPE